MKNIYLNYKKDGKTITWGHYSIYGGENEFFEYEEMNKIFDITQKELEREGITDIWTSSRASKAYNLKKS